MLADEPWLYEVTEMDGEVFRQVIRDQHPLKLALELIPWDEFRATVEAYYSLKFGQPAFDPLRMLKLEYLRYHCNLSDRQVIERAETDISFRYFLQIGLRGRLPDASSLTRFRGRLGAKGFHAVFDKLVGVARQQGVVKDRLRLKDASHVIANIAVPTTLKLVAQMRDRLLAAATPFDGEGAQGHRINIELVRERTKGQSATEQLEARVIHLQELLAWAKQLDPPPRDQADAATEKAWQQLIAACELTRKILVDQANPDAGRRTLSIVDPEARRGKHGDWYDGYILDMMMDADSELITQLNTLEAGGDEAQDAVELVRLEEAAHGNDIEGLSIDGAGFNGEMLQALEDTEDGPGLTTYVPPKKEPQNGRFTPTDFTLSEDKSQVTCPAGQQSRYRQRDSRNNGFLYRFTRVQCDACPLAAQCVTRIGQGAFGRTVNKSDYEMQYQRARERAATTEYAAARRAHPAVERKLNEVLNHHGGRRARYWGLSKTHLQECMTCFTVNVKRLVRLTLEAGRSVCAPAVP